jgi:hypothetical protein
MVLGGSRSYGQLLYRRLKKCEIENILSINFIFCELGKYHHYSLSVADPLGPAHGTQVFLSSIFWELLF